MTYAEARDLVEDYKPEGECDKGGRWYPAWEEKASCCSWVRSPSRAWPWSLWKHCKTAKHIMTMHNEREQAVEAARCKEQERVDQIWAELSRELSRPLDGYELTQPEVRVL